MSNDNLTANKCPQMDNSHDQGMTEILTRLDRRMDVLENLLKRLFDNDHRHACCIEVLGKLDIIETLLHSSGWVTSRISHEEEDDEYSKITGDSRIQLDQGSSDVDSAPAPVLLVNNQKPGQVVAQLGLDSTVQVITLNSESDFEQGSWLGDESNPEARVRCKIPPVSLMHINTTCLSPEKMAVTLLDHLFPREVLSVSNLSGKGKHGKRQLDPLMVYGIRCHLMYKFHITEGDWYRIKQNMDSKCRTAWRKRSRGLPLGGIKVPYLYNNPSRIKHSNSNNNDDEAELSHHHQLHELISEDGQSIIVSSEAFMGDHSIEEQLETRVLHTDQGDIQVLHATPEQLMRIQHRHHIQVLREDQLLPDLQSGISCKNEPVIEEIDCGEHMLTIVTSSGHACVDMEAMEDSQEFVDADSLDIPSKNMTMDDEDNVETITGVEYIGE